jgi:hypothetical protein
LLIKKDIFLSVIDFLSPFFAAQAVLAPCFSHLSIIAVSVYLDAAHKAIEIIN